MRKYQYIAAVAISAITIFIFISRSAWPNLFVIDEKSLILIGIATLPWLTFFFKKIKLPGGLEAESNRQQGSTANPSPPTNRPAEEQREAKKFSDLKSPSKKIVKTLWEYQQMHFRDERDKRWTFTVLHIAEDYSSYVIGLGELLDLGIVSLSKDEKNAQCMLTNDGLGFCEANVDEIATYNNYYKF